MSQGDFSSAPESEAAPDKNGGALGTLRSGIGSDRGLGMACIALGVVLGTSGMGAALLTTTLLAGLSMALGMYLLMKTSDILINHIAAIGRKLGISPMTLGIGLGMLTSLPELLVSIGAILQENAGLGIGNVIGSNIANILLILGVTASLRAIPKADDSWRFNMAVIAAATVLFALQLFIGALHPAFGVLLLGGLGYYCWRSCQTDSVPREDIAACDTAEMCMPVWMNAVLALAGLAGLVGAAAFLVASATAFGIKAGISPVVIGVLALAIGTSLPELTVNVRAALKGQTDMAIGNILGSNAFNILMIGGFLCFTAVDIPADLDPLDTPLGALNTAAFAGSVILLWLAMRGRAGGLARWHGFVALALYAAYTAALAMLGGAA
jgi:cation:H+ antiporter